MANRRPLALDIVLWIFALFLAWIFSRQGYAKFSDTSGWSRAFRSWHFPAWFRVLVGIAEVAAAVLLLTRRTAFAGAVIIIAVMIGAMATHIYWGRPGQVTSEILPLFLASVIALGRRHAFFLRREHPDVQ
jgi:putative oxidoreductase